MFAGDLKPCQLVPDQREVQLFISGLSEADAYKNKDKTVQAMKSVLKQAANHEIQQIAVKIALDTLKKKPEKSLKSLLMAFCEFCEELGRRTQLIFCFETADVFDKFKQVFEDGVPKTFSAEKKSDGKLVQLRFKSSTSQYHC